MPKLTSPVAKARKLLAVLREPQYRRALRYGVAASTEHESMPLRRDFRTVVDAGANKGQFALFAVRRFPQARLDCFEPLPDAGARLKRAVGHADRVKLWETALGSEDGEAEFHVSGADDSSSLLAIGERQLREFPATAEQTTIKVPVRRLDRVVTASELVSPVLLKIDVQGGELGVLEGATGILPSIDAILVEVSFVELYTGQALVDDVWEFVRRNGFTCRGVWSLTYNADGECLQGDLLFARGGFEPLGT